MHEPNPSTTPAFKAPGSAGHSGGAAPTAAGGPDPATTTASTLLSGSPVVVEVSDDAALTLAEALLADGDVLSAAMRIIRRRCGAADLAFHPGALEPDGCSGRACRVARAGEVQGWLVAGPDACAASLEPHANMLSAWLALREQRDRLRIAAETDELTGAHNRRFFQHFLSAALDEARPRRLPVSVLVFDIDNFKSYNDRFGHPAGDEILSESVRLLRSAIRPSDRVCRLGGDEFAVVFFDPSGPRGMKAQTPAAPDADTAAPRSGLSLYDICTRFQRQISEHRFPKLSSEAPGTLSISGGMATFPWDGDSVEELVQRADELALKSKRSGKNLITFGPGAERVCRIPA